MLYFSHGVFRLNIVIKSSIFGLMKIRRLF